MAGYTKYDFNAFKAPILKTIETSTLAQKLLEKQQTACNEKCDSMVLLYKNRKSCLYAQRKNYLCSINSAKLM